MVNEFSDYYNNLLISQYRDKANASSEIRGIVSRFKVIYNDFKDILKSFDIDTAIGNQLDIIGVIVGQSRVITDGIPNIFLGLSNNPNTVGFNQGYSLFDERKDRLNSNQELTNDNDYRLLIKARIALNFNDSTTRGIIQHIRNVISTAVLGEANDRSLRISIAFNQKQLFIRLIRAKLLPTPIAIHYNSFQTHTHTGKPSFFKPLAKKIQDTEYA